MIMLYTRPAQHLSSILTSNTARSGKSLRGIIQSIKASNPDLDIYHQRYVTKTLKKLNDDPNAVVTNKMTKDVVRAMGKANILKSKYQADPTKAIVHVKRMFGTTRVSNANPESWKNLPKEEREKKVKSFSNRMRERAREARSEENAKNPKAIRSLGLQDWQNAKGSISQVGKEKDIQRIDNKKNEESPPDKVADMVID